MKSFRKACRGQKGFTLIELLVVIIILGVLAAVVTLAVTRFIGKGTLESANAELVTVQAAVESCLADANAAQFDDASYDWTGDLATSPVCTLSGNETVTAYEMMRTHKLKATYTINQAGDVTDADPDGGSASSGWGSTKITFNTTDQVWEKV
jgi:prepilin-type N-terminal cleavage/methylation domain-containing protein